MPPSLVATIRSANQALLAEGRLDAIGTYFSPDYRVHLTDGEAAWGHDEIRRFVSALRRAFPDVDVDVAILIEGTDRVAWQRTLRGTHRRSFRGFPATGRRMVWRDLITTRVQDGLIVEEWAISDLAERLLMARASARPARR